MDTRPQHSGYRPAAQSAQRVDRVGDDAGGKTPPSGMDNADRIGGQQGNRCAIGRVHCDRDAGDGGHRRIRRSAHVFPGTIDGHHLASVDLVEPGPRKVDHRGSPMLHTFTTHRQITVLSFGEAVAPDTRHRSQHPPVVVPGFRSTT